MVVRETAVIANFIASTTALVSDHGITMETGSDFLAYKRALEKQPERGGLIPAFDPAYVTFDDQNAFWIIGRDRKDEIVHTQAMCMVDMGGDSLAAFIENHCEEFTPSNWVFDSGKSRYWAAPGSHMVTGNVCCHGEFWIKGGPDGFRNKGIAILLARIAMALSLMKWSPDFVFALMQSLTICKGLAARAGFMHTAQTNLFWSVPGYSESLEVWAAWVSREDIRHLLKIPPNVLCQQLNSFKAGQKAKKVA